MAKTNAEMGEERRRKRKRRKRGVRRKAMLSFCVFRRTPLAQAFITLGHVVAPQAGTVCVRSTKEKKRHAWC